jgi:putative transposase
VKRARQLMLARTAGHGGKREGAGRKPGARPSVPHRARPPHKRYQPVHATLRARPSLPRFRGARLFRAMRAAIGAASKAQFRVVHFSVQNNHLHLFVEAEDNDALSRGMRGLVTRVAKAVNRATERTGAVWGDRYHTHELRSAREVRHALVYVMSNWRKHLHVPSPTAIDPCSSAPWFTGWTNRRPLPLTPDAPIRPPQTGLARKGWLHYGPISPREAPGRSA